MLFVRASSLFVRLFLFIPAYVCFGLASKRWIYPDAMWPTDTNCRLRMLLLFLLFFVLQSSSQIGFRSGGRNPPLEGFCPP